MKFCHIVIVNNIMTTSSIYSFVLLLIVLMVFSIFVFEHSQAQMIFSFLVPKIFQEETLSYK